MEAPLSTKANRTRSYEQTHYHEDNAVQQCGEKKGRSWIGALVLFVVILIVVWACIYWLNPECLQKCDKDGHYEGKADTGKTFCAAFVFTVVIFVLFGLFAVSCNY